MAYGPGLTAKEIEALFQEAADPAFAFLYDDKVKEALVAQLCELSGCSPAVARLGLWAVQQAAAGLAATGAEWLLGKAAAGAAGLLRRCPGADRLMAAFRQLLGRARDDAAFRDELAAIARGEREPDLSRLPKETPEDVALALRLLEEQRDLALYLAAEFDALHDQLARMAPLLERGPSDPDLNPIPEPLPAAPDLVGRTAERQSLVALLTDPDDPSPVLVQGGPGIGKTALTLAAAHDPSVEARFPRRLFVSLQAVFQGAGILDAVGKAMGLRESPERTRKALVRLAGVPTLLILDNLETPWERPGESAATADGLGKLGGVPGVRLLASIRGSEQPNGLRWRLAERPPGPLAPAEARELFCRVSPEAATDAGLPALLDALGGVPLAIDLVAGRHRDGDGDALALLAEWRRRRTELARRGAGGERENDLAASIELSLGSPRLDHPRDAGRRLFAMLGRLPDGMADACRRDLLGDDAFEATSGLRRVGLAFPAGQRLRALAPIRAHGESKLLSGEDAARFDRHYEALAVALPQAGRASTNIALERRAREELGNLDYLTAQAIDALPEVPDLEQVPTMRVLAVRLSILADTHRLKGGVASAASLYARAHAVIDRLAAADPDNAEWQRDLSISWSRLGDVRAAQGDLPGALQAYMAGKEIRDRLAAADPGNAGWQRDLILSHVKLAEADPAQAATRYAAALQVAEALAASGRLAPRDAWMVEDLRARLAAASAPDPAPKP